MNTFQNGAPNKFVLLTQGIFSRVFFKQKRILEKFKNVGEISDYLLWVNRVFPDPKLFLNREQLWKEIILISKIDEGGKANILEFGVAWGYATNWFMTNLRNKNILWQGFDTFTGLPMAWRNLENQHFSNNGEFPKVLDPRVKYHKGLVEETLEKIDTTDFKQNQLFLFFDLDLYEPTTYSFNYLKKFLKPGDIIYFDEAFDGDERRVLKESVINDSLSDFFLREGLSVRLIGITPMALALEII
jgi:hypothetical protein